MRLKLKFCASEVSHPRRRRRPQEQRVAEGYVLCIRGVASSSMSTSTRANRGCKLFSVHPRCRSLVDVDVHASKEWLKATFCASAESHPRRRRRPGEQRVAADYVLCSRGVGPSSTSTSRRAACSALCMRGVESSLVSMSRQAFVAETCILATAGEGEITLDCP